MNVYLGADPGANGGIALISADGTLLMVTKLHSDDDAALLAQVKAATERLVGVVGATEGLRARRVAVLEQAHASPQMGVTSAFSFGGSFRALRMALVACGWEVVPVHSTRWQRALDCRTGGDKNVTKTLAMKLYPNIKVTHATADALLLATYGREFNL